MRYKDLKRGYSQGDMELDMLDQWDEHKIFDKVQNTSAGSKPFVFYEGPPTANGLPGVHHIIARTVKDIVCRYKTMTGHFVERKGGWDTHGLPVEIEVEKKLGLKDKKEVEDYGIEKFNKACKNSVFEYLQEWEEITRRIGYWLDMDDPYITFKNEYIESVWWLLSQYFKDGKIYKGHRITPWCPRCETGLSDHELSQGYQDVKDPSIYVKFRIPSMKDTFFMVWTTTPWTLLSNVALAVHPDNQYVKIKHEDEYLILVHQRALALFGEDIQILEKFSGKDLVGIYYEPLFKFVEPDKKAWYVIQGDFVTIEDGTGIVHTAPAFGQEDYRVGQENGLPMIQLVTEQGKIPEAAKPFAGMFIKDADPEIIKDLKIRGLLFKKETIEHSYPFCWRCKSPLLYFARASWYIKTTEYKDKMIEENEKIDWYPKAIGHGRLGEWLKNNIDWSISRERFWGTPLNIWICEDCGEMKSIESRQQLKALATQTVPDDIDLHRPFVDDIELACECGGTMKRTPEVIDCWFDSGAMPFAQMHYPFEHKDDFDEKYFPADFISEGVDQTRGWFYTLLAISTFVKGQAAYKANVVVGLVLDAEGRKMSKSLGNSIAPREFFNKWGADPLRWFMISNSHPWLPTRMSLESVGEVSSKVFDTLKNVYKFFATYANIDDFKPADDFPYDEITMLDKWILSRSESLIKRVSELMEEYDMTRATREIGSFILDEVSNWYVRRSRRRFWVTGDNSDKNAAYHTLYRVLMTTAKLMAPFAPMTADAYYNYLGGKLESIHMEEFPAVEEKLIDEKLEEYMQRVLELSNLGRAVRNKAQIKIRQPLRTMYTSAIDLDMPEDIMALALDELNVKNIEDKGDRKFTKLTGKPNFKTLGRKLGKYVQKSKEIIENWPEETLKKIEKGESVEIEIGEHKYEILPEDVLLDHEDDPDYITVEDGEMTISISRAIDEEMRTEGLAREIINRIQNTRKNAGFEVTDRIEIYMDADDKIQDVAKKMKDYISSETLAEKLEFKTPAKYEFKEEWKIDDFNMTLYLKRI